MRGAREEDRFRSPMFPRLHVNDTEKGGPRAPPRNKMALYEQLSVPSQRFGSMMPHSGNNESSSVSSMSSSHAGSFERSVFNRFRNSPAPSHSENSFAPYSNGVDLSSKLSREQQKALNSSDNQRLNSTQPLPSNPKCNSFQPHKSNFKHFLLKKTGDEGDRRAPSSANFGPLSISSNKDRENQPNWNLSFSMQFKSAFEKKNSEIGIKNIGARESNAFQDPSERSFSVLSNKTPADSSLKRAHQSTNLELDRFQTDSSKRFRGANDQSVPDFVVIEETTVHHDKNLLESNEAFSKSTPIVDKSQNMVETGNKNLGGRKHRSLSALTVTPDDVVKVLGEKQFWKARKAIVNQQRMFEVQVFELHRLMKVQKLIAELPDLLLGDNIYLGKALLKSSPVQKVPSLQPEQQPPLVAKSREISQKTHPISDTNKELAATPNHESYSHSGAAEGRQSPWCVPAPGNQWLVPVMTPSEGLVYKPYGAPCHPNAGYMAPVYSPYVQSYFPQYYGMPMMAPSVWGSALEQQSSCNMSSQMSRTVTRFVRNVQPSKESEIQGSTGSSIPPRPNKGALPLFPTEKTCRSSDQKAESNEQQTHVIKVVPHNRKLATESAARIFRFITEERNQCC